MSTNVHLTPDLEKFARGCVEEGRYNNISEVVRSALRLLQEQEERRKAFADMIAETRAESEREGYVTIEELDAELEGIINGERE